MQRAGLKIVEKNYITFIPFQMRGVEQIERRLGWLPLGAQYIVAPLRPDGNTMSAMFDYYKGRRVLITGHTGFKGSWLTHWLKLLDAEVCGIALAPDTVPSMFELIQGADNIISHQFDLADAAAVQRVVQAFQPEIVFHLAAQSLVRRSYDRPVETFMSNVMGTAHVLEAARPVASVRGILIVTSDKVYKNSGTGKAFVEDDRLGGDDP